MSDLRLNKFEYISPDGLRLDGRKTHEHREVKFKLSVFKKSDGSCLFQQGKTKVIVAVSGPQELKNRRDELEDRCRVSCEYSIAKFATGTRRARVDKSEKAASLLIRQTFSEVIVSTLYPRGVVKIFVKVIEDDGGVLSAAINATTLALIDAGIAMKDFLVCTVVGLLERSIVLDTNTLEQNAGGAQLNVAIFPNVNQKVGMVVSKDMNSRSVTLEKFEKMITMGISGGLSLHKMLNTELKRIAKEKFNKKTIF